MKKTRVKEKAGDRPQDVVAKVMPKKPGKSQLVRLKPKKSSKFAWPAVGAYWQRSVQFIKEAWIELKKVTWPGQKETVGATGVVLALVFLVSFYLGLVDLALSRLVKYLMG
ncbi:MAG: preprotein translocase subunit SecE [Desulfobacca sp.]|uniref:preprotein translocase subunit SecE n=1 Tax=Desulfobacca sp. TaxID=2067990 RepID=UPI004049AAD8